MNYRPEINYRVSDLANSIFRVVVKMKRASFAEKLAINYQLTRLDAAVTFHHSQKHRKDANARVM
jgi:hypothetical protein